jgi:predicted Zn-dependent protease
MKKLLFGFIVIVALIGGAYLVLNRPGSSGQATGTEPAEYVTHTSKDFSFEYPRGWYIHDGTDAVIFPRVGITNYDPDVYVESPHATGNFFKFEVVKHGNVSKLSLREWIDDYFVTAASNDARSDVLVTSEATVAGMPAIKFVARVRGVTYEAVYVSENRFVYEFIFGGPIYEEFRPVFDRILETFQFNPDYAE